MRQTAIKICGLRDLAIARAALDAGADYLGFVLAPSRRRVSAEEVRSITRELPDSARTVGVFVNEPAATINKLVAECGLGYAQLSGDEPPEVVSAIRAPVLKAFRVGGAEPTGLDRCRPDVVAFVLDGARDGAYGGTGRTCDWTLAAQIAARHPSFLAGGLTPENVGEAIAHVRPFGVDVSSGVESSEHPGKKDIARIAAFIEAVRMADRWS
jgi:phosphoribosylanthranilate isomerase